MKTWQKTTLAVLVSGITGFGGHFLNRRWDRAVLFFALALTWSLVGSFAFMWSLDSMESKAIFAYPTFMLGGFAIVWLLSVVVTALDAARAKPATITRWTPSGIAAALLVALLGLTLTGYHYTLYGLFAPYDATDYSEDEALGDYAFFHASTRFGGRSAFRGERPPSGDGLITGRVIYDGKPVAGVSLRLYLNEQYQTDELRTDADGIYRVEVPSGAWRLNSVQAESWTGKPPGNYVMVSGHEPPLPPGAEGRRATGVSDTPLALQVSPGQPGVVPELELRPTVKLLWPDREGTPASWADGALQWAPYPGAVRYLVEIYTVTRDGARTSYRSFLSRAITGTGLAVSALPAADADGVSSEYSIEVTAFDAQGRLLSESDRFTATFTMKDRMLIADAGGWPGPGDNVDLETLGKKHMNTKRADAAGLLIDEGLLDAAEALLGRIQGPTDPGEKAALEGYLRARQGRCDEAQALFEAAKAAGKSCIPERYEAACTGRPEC